MCGVLGDLDGGLDLRPGGQQAGRRGLLIGRLGQLGDLLPGRLDHIGHFYHLFFLKNASIFERMQPAARILRPPKRPASTLAG